MSAAACPLQVAVSALFQSLSSHDSLQLPTGPTFLVEGQRERSPEAAQAHQDGINAAAELPGDTLRSLCHKLTSGATLWLVPVPSPPGALHGPAL